MTASTPNEPDRWAARQLAAPARGARRRRRWPRVGLALAIGLAALAAGGVLASRCVEWWCTARPPALAARPAILDATVQEAGGVRRLGEAWIARRQGILRMRLAGDPFTLGYSNAVLTQEFIREQEASLLRTVRQFVPGDASLWALRKLVLLRNRDLPSYVAERYRVEIYGLASGYRDPFPELGPLYNRLLNYHAAHDLSHAYMDHPLVGRGFTPPGGCTSFAAWGADTRGGHLLAGRNFDFDAGRCFDENKIVIYVQPDEGLAFLSVAWPGLIGAVTGLNEKRVAIAINAAQSSDTRRIGTPVSLVVRDVLQHASTLQEAIYIIQKAQVFVADCYLVADGKTGQAAVVEKTPLRCAIRRPGGEHIVCANHFLTPELEGDEANTRYMAEGTTVARGERMEALIAGRVAPLTPADAAAILRDRTVPGVAAPVLGHPAAINSLAATHSVVIDATAGLIWVSASPHQEAAFVPFGLETFEDPPGAAPIPPDPLLSDGSYERCVRARALTRQANRAMDAGRQAAAVAMLRQTVALDPNHYMPRFLLGRNAFHRQDWAEAKAQLEMAQSLYPAFAAERRLIREMLEKCREEEAK